MAYQKSTGKLEGPWAYPVHQQSPESHLPSTALEWAQESVGPIPYPK